MALDLGTLVARIQLNTQQAEQELNDFRNDVGKVCDQFDEAGKKLMKFGAVGVGAISGLAIAGGEWQANIEGTKFMYNQLDKVIQKNIDNHAKEASALGLTSQQYTDAGVKLATYYKNMGLTNNEIDTMLASNMQLIADLGAITDVPFDEAMARFKSALMGNHEAVDALNVNLSASMMDESEYAKSIGKTTQKMSEQEKMLARLSVIQKQGAVATGLAKQEAEQFSMKLKLVTKKLKELIGLIGSTLLPILTPLLKSFEKVIDKISEWVEKNQTLVGILLAIAGAISAFSLVTGALIVGIVSLITNCLFWYTTFKLIKVGITFLAGKLVAFVSNLAIVKGAIWALKAPFVLMGKFFGLWGTAFGWIGTQIGNVIGLIGGWIGAIGSFILNSAPVQMILTGISTAFSFLGGIISTVVGAIGGALGTFGGFILRITGISRLLPLLSTGFTLLKTAIMAIASPVGILVGGFALIGGALLLFGDDLNNVLIKVGEFLTGMLNKIAEHLPTILNKGIEIISFLISGILIALPQLLAKGMEILIFLINGITQALPEIINIAIEIINTLANFLITNLPTIIDIGVQLLCALVDGLMVALPMLITGGIALIAQLVGVLIQNLPKLLEAGKQLLQAVVNGILSLLSALIEAGGQVIQSAWNGITNGLSKLVDAGKSMVESILNGIKSAWGGITSWISSGLSKLPIVGGLFKIGTEVEEPQLPNTRGLETAYKMRNSLLGDLGNVGASVKSSQTVRFKTDRDNVLLQAINKLSDALESHETTINTSVNLDGREIARGTASYIKDEIDMRTRRMNRLGGVL